MREVPDIQVASGVVPIQNQHPTLLAQLQTNMQSAREQMKQQAAPPVLLVMPQIRPLLARYAHAR